MAKEKKVRFLGDSQEQLKAFPEVPRQRLGHQLHLVQFGETPKDWKAVPGLGKGVNGVKELRERTLDGWFRLVYVASIGTKIYVLHVFSKKSNNIEKKDIKVIQQRYKEALQGED